MESNEKNLLFSAEGIVWSYFQPQKDRDSHIFGGHLRMKWAYIQVLKNNLDSEGGQLDSQNSDRRGVN